MDVETNRKKVTYSIVDSYHSLCLDKKDIIYAEIEACLRHNIKFIQTGGRRHIENPCKGSKDL